MQDLKYLKTGPANVFEGGNTFSMADHLKDYDNNFSYLPKEKHHRAT